MHDIIVDIIINNKPKLVKEGIIKYTTKDEVLIMTYNIKWWRNEILKDCYAKCNWGLFQVKDQQHSYFILTKRNVK